MRTFIGTFIVLIISTTHGFAELVTKEVLLRDIAGKRFQFSTPAGATGFIEYTKRGAMYISGSNFNPRRDRGIWWFRGRSLCGQWNTIQGGKVICSPLSKIGESRYRNTRGEIMWRK